MTVLPLAYLPSAEYFAHLLRGGCVVDLGEHFVKRSERNRARILATDGVMEPTGLPFSTRFSRFSMEQRAPFFVLNFW